VQEQQRLLFLLFLEQHRALRAPFVQMEDNGLIGAREEGGENRMFVEFHFSRLARGNRAQKFGSLAHTLTESSRRVVLTSHAAPHSRFLTTTMTTTQQW
jgi:hypothetical protein